MSRTPYGALSLMQVRQEASSIIHRDENNEVCMAQTGPKGTCVDHFCSDGNSEMTGAGYSELPSSSTHQSASTFTTERLDKLVRKGLPLCPGKKDLVRALPRAD